MNVLTFVYSSQAFNNTAGLQDSIKNNPPKIVYVQAKDGYTPIKGKDYFDGATGLNAMSFSITNTIIKEVPLPGIKGDKGDSPACLLEETQCRGANGSGDRIRINPTTGDLETKLDDARFWSPLLECDEFRLECPGNL